MPLALAALDPVNGASVIVAVPVIVVLLVPPTSTLSLTVTVGVHGRRVGAFLDVAASDRIDLGHAVVADRPGRRRRAVAPINRRREVGRVVARIGVGKGGVGQRHRRAVVAELALAALDPVNGTSATVSVVEAVPATEVLLAPKRDFSAERYLPFINRGSRLTRTRIFSRLWQNLRADSPARKAAQ